MKSGRCWWPQPDGGATVIVIREAQIAHLAAHCRRRTIAGLCDTLRGSYPERLTALSPIALYRRVRQAVVRAEEYGLQGKDDWYRYLELAVLHGWDFDRQPALAWMHECLIDERISLPTARLARLCDQRAQRIERDALNRETRARFALRRAARGRQSNDR